SPKGGAEGTRGKRKPRRREKEAAAPTAAAPPAPQSTEPIPEDVSPATPEQQRVATGQYERAVEVLADDNFEYGIPLPMMGCQLDPTNVTYRAALRQAQRRKLTASPVPRWLAWAKTIGSRRSLKKLKKAGDHLKILQLGEEILALLPGEIPIHLDMADAAQER